MANILDGSEKNKKNEILNIELEETNCQRFTPIDIAEYMISFIDINESILNKKILENSFGNGIILVSLVNKILQYFIEININLQEVRKFLENNIVGYEIDQVHLDECRNKLNKVSSLYGLDDIEWNLNKKDYLSLENNDNFDYIIGNPPYISHRNMSKHFPIEYMDFLKNNFDSCNRGAFDYSFPFVEKSYFELNDRGKLIYILPNSIFKNKSAKRIRQIIVNDLTEIINFSPFQLFDDALVAVSIIIVEKNSNTKKLKYSKRNPNKLNQTKNKIIDKLNFIDRFIFSNGLENKGNTRFGDIFKASMTVATLLNDAFIIKEDDLPLFEPELIKKAVSPKNINKNNQYIIFPYQFDGESFKVINEEKLKKNYPRVFGHLYLSKEKLEKRQIEPSTLWFEYGRSQGFNIILKEKLLMSSLVTKRVKLTKINPGTIAYSGIWISQVSSYSLDICIKILSEDKFMKYIEKVSSNASGETIRVKTTDINNYRFNIEDYI